MLNHTLPRDIFGKLMELNESLYLTGSRFFDCPRINSDWDYIAEYNTKLVKKLILLGFERITYEYTDSYIVSAMRYIGEGIQIDVQLVKDVELKLNVQNALKYCGYLRPTKYDWELAYKLTMFWKGRK